VTTAREMPFETIECELTLFVSGASDLSARAIAAARELCDIHLAGRSVLRVVDIHGELGVGIGGAVLATPTLVREVPLPVRKIVGDLSDICKVLRTLELEAQADATRAIG
jgi:circadian clock protein KaiB